MNRSAAFLVLGLLTSALASNTSTVPSGTWKVTAHRYGDSISVGDAQAKSWLGKTVTYSRGRAISGKDICTAPTYTTHIRDHAYFLDQYRTSLHTIGIKGASVRATTVQCRGSAWTAFGATLFQLPGHQLLTVWDGVYFVLTKQP